MGIGGLRYRRNVAREVILRHESVTFVSSRAKLTIPVMDVVEVRRSGAIYDINHMIPLEVRTKTHEAIRLDSRLGGLLDLLLQLKILNPALITSRV